MSSVAPLRRHTPFILMAVVCLVLVSPGSRAGLATFSSQAANDCNTFSTDTLAPPTGLTASVVGSNIRLDWTPTTDTYASGYYLRRATTSGGPYVFKGSAQPYTASTWTDTTADAGIRYYYVAESFFQNWRSVYSNEADAMVSGPVGTGWQSPTAQAAVTGWSGDNNGFESNPTNALADGGGYAQDVDSGTVATQYCYSISRDSHLFYNYDFSIPSGSTINGIEVRLDAWADHTSGNPKMCVQLSWDGGASWTAAKSTADLTTSEQTHTLGSASDSWDRTWSYSEFSNGNFRVFIRNVASDTTTDFRLDWVPVEVTYTPP